MTSVEAPVLCLQKQPDQTQTPGRCPESHTSAQLNYVYQKGVAQKLDHKTAHLTQKKPAALKFFPNSASTSGQKLHAPMDFFWFRLGLDSIPTNIIPSYHTPSSSSSSSSSSRLEHRFYIAFSVFGRTILPRIYKRRSFPVAKTKQNLQFFQSHFSSKNFPGLKFLQMIRPNLSSLGFNDSTTSSMEVPWCFMKAAPRLRPKELQPYLPTTDLPSQTNRPMPWYATMPLPSLHSCYEFFAFVPGKVGQWIETEILKKSCGA